MTGKIEQEAIEDEALDAVKGAGGSSVPIEGGDESQIILSDETETI